MNQAILYRVWHEELQIQLILKYRSSSSLSVAWIGKVILLGKSLKRVTLRRSHFFINKVMKEFNKTRTIYRFLNMKSYLRGGGRPIYAATWINQ